VLDIIIKGQLFIGLFLLNAFCVNAQVAGGATPAPPAPVRTVSVAPSQGVQAPQVVTVIHRLSGMKVLSLLHRGGQSPKIVGDEFVTNKDMLTSVTAGLALGDGKTVVARLPQAEAELDFNLYWPAQTAPLPRFGQNAPKFITPNAAVAPSVGYRGLPELQVIQRDGKPHAARYVGLDVGSGLSLLQIEGLNAATPRRDADEEKLSAGQRVRLLAPQRTYTTPAGFAPIAPPGKLYLTVGEIEGKITGLKRSANGKLANLTISAPKLTGDFAGGIVLDDTGEAIGIVEASEGSEARVMPIASVRRAAERVLARRGNVPQPWLGIRGQAMAATSLPQLLSRGWTQQQASLLQAQRYGILLTAVAPNTPAALANLRSGDVIVKLNEDEVKGVEDFSFMLNEIGSGAIVNFTVLRREPHVKSLQLATPQIAAPQKVAPLPLKELERLKSEIVSVKLSESLKPVRSTWEWETKPRFSYSTDPLAAMGIESIPLSPKAAARLGAASGLLVVYVNQESSAARSGLRVFDIIESIDGKLVSPSNVAAFFSSIDAQPKNFTIIRDRQKFKFTFTFSFSMEDTKKQ
jgi:S1-C subfamily serine protease